MAKEKRNQASDKATGKQNSSSGGFTSSAWFRNGVIIAALGIVFLFIYNLNNERAVLPDLHNEFDDLKERPGDHDQRLSEIAHRLHDIETDTGFVKSLVVGYFDEIHFVAFGVQNQIENANTEIRKLKAQFGNDADGPITREDKLSYKVHTFMLMNFINANCPPNSVILLPPADSLQESKWNFVWDPMWVEYFIYPRLCVGADKASQSSELAKRATHVLIIKGIGYDKLKYDVPLDKREKVCLLPINKPMDSTQTSN